MAITEDPATRPFDPDALRNKYREERDKRLRDDGNEPATRTTGAHFRNAPSGARVLSGDPMAGPSTRTVACDDPARQYEVLRAGRPLR